MNKREVFQRAEAVLLAMVAEGRASFGGQGPRGPIFRADRREALDRMESAGLLGDGVPWIFTVMAHATLVKEATR